MGGNCCELVVLITPHERRPGVWKFPIRGPKWPKELSPGFTLGSCPPPELALKGPCDTAIIDSDPLNRIACAFLAPSGRNVYFGLTQGKPWAKLFWPLRATDWPYPSAFT